MKGFGLVMHWLIDEKEVYRGKSFSGLFLNSGF